MKVVILCGGKGTRLREETEFRPKPMVPIGERPILWHIMKTYAAQGHKDFILCLGYKGEIIKEFFRNYLWQMGDVSLQLGRSPKVRFHNHHDEEDWKVTLAETGLETMTAGRIKRIERYIGKDSEFLLTYGDGLSNIDVNASIRAHRRAGKICTISAVHPAGRFGSLNIGNDGSIHTFNEKPQVEQACVNGGFMVCSRKVFNYLSDDPTIMFEREPISKLVADGQLHSYHHSGFWQPMDTYQETQYLNRLWSEGKAPWKIW
ncbi:MAG TPA: glucose-1-phosphate cytidylyltransferase [Candidatus Paceibacterota bacterium]|nr:glucose-1-phosphate cytidylyltransferase [Candidatus Paceibacterota bacterium]